MTARLLYCGGDVAVRAAVERRFGMPSTPLAGAGPFAAGDTVVVEAFADLGRDGAVPAGHAFALLRQCKSVRGVAAWLVARQGDATGALLARFLLADGVLVWHVDAQRLEDAEPAPATPGRQRERVDALLARIEGARAPVSDRTQSALQRLLQFEADDSILRKLQDPETGLFSGPYASVKLEEEWKRARRFHLPLSLVLLDIGLPQGAELSLPQRRGVLAEAAGVFLNECRDIDILARFTESVFLFLLPGTGPDGGGVLVRRILAALASVRAGTATLAPKAGLAFVPNSDVPDRRAFLHLAEACLQGARSGLGEGGLCASLE